VTIPRARCIKYSMCQNAQFSSTSGITLTFKTTLYFLFISKQAHIEYFQYGNAVAGCNIKTVTVSNSNSNWGLCIAPCTRRPRAHDRFSLFLGVEIDSSKKGYLFSCRRNESVDRISIRSVCNSISCFMLAVQQQSSVADSSKCPRHDKVAIRRGT